jgi:hypothetical protein
VVVPIGTWQRVWWCPRLRVTTTFYYSTNLAPQRKLQVLLCLSTSASSSSVPHSVMFYLRSISSTSSCNGKGKASDHQHQACKAKGGRLQMSRELSWSRQTQDTRQGSRQQRAEMRPQALAAKKPLRAIDPSKSKTDSQPFSQADAGTGRSFSTLHRRRSL